MKKIVSILIFMLFMSLSARSQSYSLSSVTGAVPGSYVTVYLTFTNMINFSSFWVEFTYDQNVLQYQHHTVINTVFYNGFLVVHDDTFNLGIFANTVALWFASIPQNALNDTILSFTYLYLGGYTNLALTPVPGITMNNGSVSSFAVGQSSGSVTEDFFSLYPRPVAGERFRIACPEAGTYHLKLCNTAGLTISSVSMATGPDRMLEFDRTMIPPGLYLLSISGKKHHSVLKVLFR